MNEREKANVYISVLHTRLATMYETNVVVYSIENQVKKEIFSPCFVKALSDVICFTDRLFFVYVFYFFGSLSFSWIENAILEGMISICRYEH